MFYEQLAKTIDELDEYVKLQQLSNDTKIQERMETRFSEIKSQFDLTFSSLYMVNSKTEFVPSNDMVVGCKKIVELMRKNYKGQKSDEENNQKLSAAKKSLDENIKNEWSMYYMNSSSGLVNTLQTVIEITKDRMETQQIINRIEKGKVWSQNNENIELYVSGLNDGLKVISQLDLGEYREKILSFLKAVSQKTVTLECLTPEIINWINKENLASKFKIVFYAMDNVQ